MDFISPQEYVHVSNISCHLMDFSDFVPYVIMYSIFRFIIKFDVTIWTLNMLAVDFVCWVPHIHLGHPFVLKALKASVGRRPSI